jgi:D-alanine-D-alanine ligase
MSKAESILILHNVPRAAEGGGARFRESDAGVLDEANAVAGALRDSGVRFRQGGVRRLQDIPDVLAGGDEGIVFNLVEELEGGPRDAVQVPALCRAAGKAFTGSDVPCLALTLDKWNTKAALAARGIPTPRAALAVAGASHRVGDLPAGRLIVKPVSADASEGIDGAAVVDGKGAALEAAVSRVHGISGQSALIEEFIDGREVNVAVLQRGGKAEVLAVAEIDFLAYPAGKARIVDYNAKWLTDSFEYRHTPRKVPADLPAAVEARVRELSLAAWEATECQDYARVDFRIDRAGVPFVLEVNSNPDIGPEGGFAAALASRGIAYAAFVSAILDNARSRRRTIVGPPSRSPGVRHHGATAIRRTEAGDRDAIMALLSSTRLFRPCEVAIAREVLDQALADGPSGDYQSYTAVTGGEVSGWVCFGQTPCALGTFDIYWIAVASDLQGKGVGSALLTHAEELIRQRGGRLVVIETSARPDYDRTQRFYAKCGYTRAALVPAFYAPDDGKAIYLKTVAAGG